MNIKNFVHLLLKAYPTEVQKVPPSEKIDNPTEVQKVPPYGSTKGSVLSNIDNTYITDNNIINNINNNIVSDSNKKSSNSSEKQISVISKGHLKARQTKLLGNLYAKYFLNKSKYKFSSKKERTIFKSVASKIEKNRLSDHNKFYSFTFEKLADLYIKSMFKYCEDNPKMKMNPTNVNSNWWVQNVFCQYMTDQFPGKGFKWEN